GRYNDWSYNSGDWGGASRHTDKPDDKCSWLNPERIGYFHGGRMVAGSGGQGYMPGTCFDSGTRASAFSHELGHNMNLGHGASQTGGTPMNCQPNYKSIMSYALIYDDISSPAFSRGEFSNVVLNPTAVDESLGLNTTDPEKLKHLGNNSFLYTVDPATGGIDWNRDGQISGVVRAAVTWGWGKGGGCEFTAFQYDPKVEVLRGGTALAWSSWCDSIGTCYPLLHWFARNDFFGGIEYRTATRFPDDCGTPPGTGCRTNWSIPSITNSTVGGFSAPAAASQGTQIVVVYTNTSGRLFYQVLTRISPTGGEWTAARDLSSSTYVSGDPAAVTLNDEVYVYAVSNGTLLAWRRSLAGTWSGPLIQYWTDGIPIGAAQGIGVAVGYLRESSATYRQSGEYQIAAIPMAPDGQIELAKRNPTSGTWTKFDSSIWPNGKPTTEHQPSLAYEPFDPHSSTSNGRFYLAWNPTRALEVQTARLAGKDGRKPVLMAQTEGNNTLATATAQRFVWATPAAYFFNAWAYAESNVTLHYDMRYDRNLRASYTYDKDGGTLVFLPIADGIFNTELRDQDDYAVIMRNLPCSFKQTTCW
ncbi:MAG: hypothetical protein V2A73_07565, partial [Pseudomonadota bacterium]